MMYKCRILEHTEYQILCCLSYPSITQVYKDVTHLHFRTCHVFVMRCSSQVKLKLTIGGDGKRDIIQIVSGSEYLCSSFASLLYIYFFIQ